MSENLPKSTVRCRDAFDKWAKSGHKTVPTLWKAYEAGAAWNRRSTEPEITQDALEAFQSDAYTDADTIQKLIEIHLKQEAEHIRLYTRLRSDVEQVYPRWDR